MTKSKKMSDKNTNEGLVTCPHCGSSLCYAQRDEKSGVEVWACTSCGYSSTNLLKEGSEQEKAFGAKQPQLYRDLKFIDKDGYVWYPSVVTVPEKGMVFIDGTSKENWEWASSKFIRLSRQQKRARKRARLPDKDFTMGPIQKFGQNGYIEAVASIDMFGDISLDEDERNS